MYNTTRRNNIGRIGNTFYIAVYSLCSGLRLRRYQHKGKMKQKYNIFNKKRAINKIACSKIRSLTDFSQFFVDVRGTIL